LTITSTVSGGSTEDVFKNIVVTGQPTVTADSSTDTLTFTAGDGISITTDDATDAITFTNNKTRILSKLGYFAYTETNGTSTELPLRNFFINNSTTIPVNGGGSLVGLSTRALRLLQSDGSTYKFMIMPANSAGDSLTLTFTKSDGSTVTKDVTMAA